MPKKRPPTEVEKLVDQLLGSNPTHQELEDVIGRLFGTAGVAGLAGAPVTGLAGAPLGFGPAPIELPEPPPTVQTFTVRVDLRGAKPPIWRLLEIPGDTTLVDVHEILQIAMGWTDSHLHGFELHTGSNRPGARFVNDLDEDKSGTHEAHVRLDQVLTAVGDKLRYEYDFGDGWEHVLVVKGVDPSEERRVRCIGGRRACPPEDCGGIWGYEELVEALTTPRGELDDWARERLDWLPGGDGFDPSEFDREETDLELEAWSSGHRPVGPAAALLGGPTPAAPVAPTVLAPLLAMGTGVPAALAELIDMAGLDHDAPEPSIEVAAQLVQPWVVLLSEVGDELKLTGAGYLPPASVERVFGQLGMDDEWIGKGNREDQTLPVADLRSSAQALGLVRKRTGRLLPTAAGRRLAGDPAGLLEGATDPLALLGHIESRLPLHSSPIGEQAALLLLIFAAAGRHPGAALAPAGEILTQLGWRVDAGPVTARAITHFASNTYAVLERLHLSAGGSDRYDVTETVPAVRDLARRVLRD